MVTENNEIDADLDANPGERVGVAVRLRNAGSATATAVTGALSAAGPGATLHCGYRIGAGPRFAPSRCARTGPCRLELGRVSDVAVELKQLLDDLFPH